MSTDPDSTPFPGKRQHSDGRSSGSSSPRQTNAAGTAFPNKKVKLDDGKVTKDTDFESKDASHFTSTLDGSHLKDVNIPTPLIPAEITETMTSPTVESPRSIYSSVTHRASPTARQASSRHRLHPTTKEKVIYGTPKNDAHIQARDHLLHAKVGRWKNNLEPPKVTYETPGSLLYDAIVQEHEELLKEGKVTNLIEPFDPLKEWFHRLGLPCHPVRVKYVSSKKKKGIRTDQADIETASGPSVDPQTTPRAAALPLPSDLTDPALSGTSGRRGESVDKKVTKAENSGRDLTASTLDCATMNNHYNWVFSFPAAKPQKPYNIYKWKEKRTEEQVATPAPQMVERPVPPKPRKGKSRELARLLENNLASEKDRMLDPKSLTPKLRIPFEWKEEAARPASSFHRIADDYKVYFPLPTKGAHRVPQPFDLHSVTSSEGSQADPNLKIDEGKAIGLSTPTQQSSPLPGATDPEPEEAEQTVKTLLEAHVERELKEAELQRKARENLDKSKHGRKRAAIGELFGAKDADLENCLLVLTREEIQKCDAEELCGDTTYNEDASDLAEYPPTIINRFLAYGNATKVAQTEGRVEKTAGGVILGIVVGKNITDHDNRPLPFPPHLQVVDSTPSPDAFVRASMDLEWPDSLLPVVYAAEAKPICTLDEDKIGAQLAAAFHGTLIILILYYLDTRKNLDSVLPPWLFLYGVEYTETGVNITAHHPSYVFDGDSGHWELHAKLLTTDYFEVFRTGNPDDRLRLLAVLFRIRSHSLFVLEKLRMWKGAPAVLDVLVKKKPAKRPSKPLKLNFK